MKQLYRADDKTPLGYAVLGEGPRVITCLHSLSLDGSWFGPLALALGDTYRLILPDLRGHGASELVPLPLTLRAMVDDVRRLWDLLEIETSSVLGISLGGMVAQGLAATDPDRVAALVLIATTSGFDDSARAGAHARATAARAPGGLAAMVDPIMARWFGPRAADPQDELVARARAQFMAADPEVHASCLEAMLEVGSFRLGENPPPTLVLGGADDLSAPRTVVEALAASIPGAEFHIVPGDHLPAFTNPGEVAERVAAFLDAYLAAQPVNLGA
jgi:pimeloyl-ACP methyl ester carboxylesterase